MRRPPRLGEKGYERVAFDEYRTPAWVTDVLVDAVPGLDRVWEPAAGQLDMAEQFKRRGLSVITSDIRTLPGLDYCPLDFTSEFTDIPKKFGSKTEPWAHCVATNPPYAHAESFILRALDLMAPVCGSVAMLLAYEFDAPASHHHLFRRKDFRAKIVLPRRIQWVGFENKASPRQVHAWYFWDCGGNPLEDAVIIYPPESPRA